MGEVVLKKTKTSLLYTLSFKGGQQILSLCMAIPLARILSPDEFGVVAVANMIVYYGNNFTNFGLNNALVQKKQIEELHINTVFTLDLIVSTLLAILTVCFSKPIANIFNNQSVENVLKWMSLYYIITTFYYIPVVILRRNIEYRLLSAVEFFGCAVGSLTAIFLALLGFSYWSIVISSLLVPFLVAIMLIVKVRWVPKIVIGKNMGDLYTFGFWNFVRTQVQLIVSKIDYFFIGRHLGMHSLGLYEKSFEMTDRCLSGITLPINSVFFSTFSRLKKDSGLVKQVFLKGSGFVALLTYPALLGLVGVAPHFVMAVLGAQWVHAIIPMQILSIACVFRVSLGTIASVNVAIGKYKIHTLFNIFSASIFVILCFLFVSRGITFISVSFLVYCLVSFIMSFFVVRSSILVTSVEFFKAIWCPLLGSFLMLSLLIILRNYVLRDFGSILELFYLVMVGSSFYIIWCYLFYRKGVVSFSIEAASL